MTVRVIGIDPGSRVTGYAVIARHGRSWRHVDNGVIAPKATLPMFERLHLIHQGLTEVVGRYRPEAMALEAAFVDENPQTAIKLGQARGMAMLVAAQCGLVLAEYTPLKVKQTIVGYGRATKSQIQDMVKRHFSLPEVACEDASDALAIAYTHALIGEGMLAGQSSARPRGRREVSSWRNWKGAA